MSGGLWQETLALGEDYLSHCCCSRWPAPPPPSRPAGAMRHLAERMEQQHRAHLHALAQTLRQQGPDPCSLLRRVMGEMSGDGRLTWGRVVSVFSFAGVMAKQQWMQRSGQGGPWEEAQTEEEQAEDNRRLAEAIADYLADEQKEWLLEHDGWDGFCEFYQHSAGADHNPSVKTALYAAAGVGIAGLTFLAARKMCTYVLHVLFHVLLSTRNP